MDQTKIHLSGNELTLMQNSAWILTKNSVIEKMGSGLGNLAARMRQRIHEGGLILLEEVMQSDAKVSKGEKYQGLPYLILDYPRVFGKEHILAIRTMFWWGNYCSVTLHARGRFVEIIRGRLKDRPVSIPGRDIYLSYSGDEWSHDLYSPAYQALQSLIFAETMATGSAPEFLKISLKTPLAQWQVMEDDMFDSYEQLLQLLVH